MIIPQRQWLFLASPQLHQKKKTSLLTLLVCPTTIHAPQKLCSTIASTIYSNYGKKNIVLNSNLQVIEATHGKKKTWGFYRSSPSTVPSLRHPGKYSQAPAASTAVPCGSSFAAWL